MSHLVKATSVVAWMGASEGGHDVWGDDSQNSMAGLDPAIQSHRREGWIVTPR